MNKTSQFDVVVGIDMETDIGSFTAFYRGVQQGTPRLLDVLHKHEAKATFFWTGHAAENNPAVVRQVRAAGHETGCHGLYRETLGDPLFELPNNWPILPEEGYSPSVGRPLCLGKMTPRQRELVEFGLEMHYKTYDWMQAGTIAADVAKQYAQAFQQRGYQANYLYGPCHGLGMLEVEPPWVETVSNYPLAQNMTFQVDTFVTAPDFGLRWENGVRIAAGGRKCSRRSGWKSWN